MGWLSDGLLLGGATRKADIDPCSGDWLLRAPKLRRTPLRLAFLIADLERHE